MEEVCCRYGVAMEEGQYIISIWSVYGLYVVSMWSLYHQYVGSIGGSRVGR